MTEFPDGKTIGTVIGSVIATLIVGLWGNSAWRRRAAGDKVVVSASDGETSLVEKLHREIDRREAERVSDYTRWAAERQEIIARADRLNDERNAAIEQIGALRQQVHDLSAKVFDLSAHVERVERIAEAHRESAEGLRRQLSAFMQLHEVGAEKPAPNPKD